MFSSVIILFFLGFFTWYNCSKKMRWKSKSIYLQAMEKEEKLSKILVIVLFLLGISLSIAYLGLMAGMMASVYIMMLMGSLIVLIFPFRYIKLMHIIALYFLCLLLEYTI